MSVKSFAVISISRGEYEQLVHRGRAGAVPAIESTPVLDRWRAEHPDWRGRHWRFIADDRDVLRLRPLNVTRAERRPIAA
ncbi:MAG: hypothetical protein JWN03_5713 [Nocardia sp.]|uniref:hypothetical protein n=1 Tax=Nocardia sp. TaxID=1821 RepID=UPI00261F583E|nr:hypothetical protein [Nocardia sp.]MCU1645438.1 hypothetical protein [Nocardia sp.]